MHDWTLRTVLFQWDIARVTLTFRTSTSIAASIVADGVVHLDVPRHGEWGPSASVNKVRGPIDTGSGAFRLQIEMQSGDTLTVSAASFTLPKSLDHKPAVLETLVDGK